MLIVMIKYLNKDEIRETCFSRTRDEYFIENEFGRRYVEKFMSDINIDSIVSDHEAKRLNGLKSFINAARFFIALGMEPFENEETKGFAEKVYQAVKNNDSLILEGLKFPYEFPDKGLKSTHFDVCEPERKGIAEKIFISIPDEKYFDDDIRDLLKEDQDSFQNDFSELGKSLLKKLEFEGKLEDSESDILIKDYMEVFSNRDTPLKKSTYESIKNTKMVGLEKDKKQHPEIMAIGLVFSGKRNHCTLPISGQEIINTPDRLETIGVPKGNPPVQFTDGLVQTSSGGIKQTAKLIDETGNQIEQAFNHEYVEYATRAEIAKVIVERGDRKKEEIVPVWNFGNDDYRSALEADRDHEGIKAGRYSKNLFESYVKKVEIVEFLKDSRGEKVKYAGFKADNATNIFLGTSEGK